MRCCATLLLRPWPCKTQWPWYMNLTWRFWRWTWIPKMNFPGESFQQLRALKMGRQTNVTKRVTTLHSHVVDIFSWEWGSSGLTLPWLPLWSRLCQLLRLLHSWLPVHWFIIGSDQPPKANSAFYLSGVGKWVRASAGKAKAGMVHFVRG